MTGPELYTNLAKLVPQKDIEYLPLVFKLLLGLDINIIRDVLSGGGKAQTYIQKLVHIYYGLMVADFLLHKS